MIMMTIIVMNGDGSGDDEMMMLSSWHVSFVCESCVVKGQKIPIQLLVFKVTSNPLFSPPLARTNWRNPVSRSSCSCSAMRMRFYLFRQGMEKSIKVPKPEAKIK